MKPGLSPTFILNNQQMLLAELYTFAFNDGSFDYFTNLDIPITYGGNTFKANGIRIEGLKFKIVVGWRADEQDVRISASPGETLGGASFFGAVEEGLLDNAYITRQRAFWAISDGRPWVDYQAAPAGVVTLSIMRVSTISKIGRSHVEMKLKSPLSLTDIDMPRNTYQPGCQWRLYDAGCTLNRATFTASFTVASATVQSVTPTISISPINGPDGLPNYLQGRFLFTSGVNNNLQTVIATNDGTTFYLQYPLVNLPSAGDTFTASLGCSKTSDTCDLKFANKHNFRGFPRVPPVMVSI